MSKQTFTSGGTTYKITVNGVAKPGKKFPVVMLLHGNYGLGAPYGNQIRAFAKDLNALGYVTAVPQYYSDDRPHPADTVPHVRTLTDAITAVRKRRDADPDRLGLIGFSLGAATAMTFIASKPKRTVHALADVFGFLTDTIRHEVARFPPTIILHNKNDRIVFVTNSRELDRLIPATIAHRRIEYKEDWQEVNHAFQPGGSADTKSRSQTTRWFVKHLPPVGK